MWGESTWESQSEGFLSFFSIFSFKHYSVFRLQEIVLENVLFIEQGRDEVIILLPFLQVSLPLVCIPDWLVG